MFQHKQKAALRAATLLLTCRQRRIQSWDRPRARGWAGGCSTPGNWAGDTGGGRECPGGSPTPAQPKVGSSRGTRGREGGEGRLSSHLRPHLLGAASPPTPSPLSLAAPKPSLVLVPPPPPTCGRHITSLASTLAGRVASPLSSWRAWLSNHTHLPAPSCSYPPPTVHTRDLSHL